MAWSGSEIIDSPWTLYILEVASIGLEMSTLLLRENIELEQRIWFILKSIPFFRIVLQHEQLFHILGLEVLSVLDWNIELALRQRWTVVWAIPLSEHLVVESDAQLVSALKSSRYYFLNRPHWLYNWRFFWVNYSTQMVTLNPVCLKVTFIMRLLI